MLRHVLVASAGALLLLTYAIGSGAEAPAVVETSSSYRYQVTLEKSPSVDASAYLVADIDSGEVLLASTTSIPYPLASVTKLLVASAIMTVPGDATTTITEADVAAPEPFGKLAVGEVYTLRELMFPYLLESSNDAGLAIERLGGQPLKTALAAVMDRQPMLTLADTTGLSAENTASADALLAAVRHVWQENRYIFDVTALPQYTTPYSVLMNNSPVHGWEGYRGGKHGYTPEANRTVVAVFATPFADGPRNLVYIVLGTSNIPDTLRTVRTLVDEAVTRIPETSGILPASSVE